MRTTPGVFGPVVDIADVADASGAGAALAAASFTSLASLSAFARSRTFSAAFIPGGISNSAASSVVGSNSVTSIAATIGLPSSPVTVVV